MTLCLALELLWNSCMLRDRQLELSGLMTGKLNHKFAQISMCHISLYGRQLHGKRENLNFYSSLLIAGYYYCWSLDNQPLEEWLQQYQDSGDILTSLKSIAPASSNTATNPRKAVPNKSKVQQRWTGSCAEIVTKTKIVLVIVGYLLCLAHSDTCGLAYFKRRW